jgi:hypothetical protein
VNPGRENKVCYLAASRDQSYGLLTGPVIRFPHGRVNALASIKLGAARYLLTRPADSMTIHESLSTDHTRFTYKLAAGVGIHVGRSEFDLKVGLVRGMGRGAGTSNIPISLSFYY